MTAEKLSGRDATQCKTFTRWLNLHLQKSRIPTQIKDINDDLISGEALVLLAEVFIPGPVVKFNQNPKNEFQRVNNHSTALDRFAQDGTELVNIHASSLAQEKDNIKVFMGLVFQLILRYSISEKNAATEADSDAERKKQSLAELKQQMIDWVNAKLAQLNAQEVQRVRELTNTQGDELRIANLDSDWSDGSALTGLTIALHPEDKRQLGLDKIAERASNLTQDGQEQTVAEIQAVIERSDKNLQVPALMDANDVKNAPDANSILTLCTYYKNAQYVDDEPAVEQAHLVWDEPVFLQNEVNALEAQNVSALEAEKQQIDEKLQEREQNLAAGRVYQPEDDVLAVRMQLHLRRVAATLANDALAKQQAADAQSNADEAAQRAAEEAAQHAAEDAQRAQQAADEAAQKQKALEEQLAEQQAAAAAAETANKQLADDLAAKQAELDAQQAEAAKLALQLALLQKKQSKLDELQELLLQCAQISDEMRALEDQ